MTLKNLLIAGVTGISLLLTRPASALPTTESLEVAENRVTVLVNNCYNLHPSDSYKFMLCYTHSTKLYIAELLDVTSNVINYQQREYNRLKYPVADIPIDYMTGGLPNNIQ